MKLLNIALLCGCLSLFSTIASAQDYYIDYVITMKGDSIPCTIRYPFLGSDMSYKPIGDKKFIKIKADEIKEYSTSDQYDTVIYKSTFVEKKPLREFLVVIEKGKINLYKEVKASGPLSVQGSPVSLIYSLKDLYISKGSDTAYFLKTNSMINLKESRKNRENQFAEMLKDNEDVYNKYIAEDKFSFKQLQNLVHLYNTGEPLKK